MAKHNRRISFLSKIGNTSILPYISPKVYV